MATIGAVLGVIRASRPTLQTAIERVAFAIHAIFLAVGYSLVAVGAAANLAPNVDRIEEPEVGCDGWNTLEGEYAFCYCGAEQFGLCKRVTLKLVVMVDSLMVELVPLDTEMLHHLEIRANDFAKDGEVAGNYAQHFLNLDGLIKQINDILLAKISPPRTMTTTNPSAILSISLNNDRFGDTRRVTSPPLIYDTRRSIGNSTFMFPPIFMGSNSDLFPRGGGGIFAPRRDFDSDGMLIGPNDVRWRQPNGGFDLDEPIILPNARYDPIAPPSVFEIDNRSLSRPPERHPDLEHF